MTSADIRKFYEKLLQFYSTRYSNPKEILYYRINELVRTGRTREEAILTLYEDEKPKDAITKKKAEEATEKQIHDYERSVERLTILFSKGEISEESYKRAIRTLEKNMDKLRKKTTIPPPKITPSHPSYRTYEKKPTSLWYLVPFLFGLLGGIIAYVGVREEDEGMAEVLLFEGIIMTVIMTVIGILAIYYFWL